MSIQNSCFGEDSTYKRPCSIPTLRMLAVVVVKEYLPKHLQLKPQQLSSTAEQVAGPGREYQGPWG